MNTRNLVLFSALAALPVLSACGGGGSGTPGNGSAEPRFSLAVTDAAVDNAANVFVSFSGVEMQPSGDNAGERVRFDFDAPQVIDLLAFQGTDSVEILSTTDAPAGDYSWIRLLVNAEPSTLDSYVVFEDGSQVSIRVPSNRLQLSSGLTINAGGLSSFTIDFDLRKALTDPQGQADILLRPSLRLVANSEVGTVAGTVDSGLVTGASCTSNPDTGAGNAVYLYLGAGVSPDDEGSATAPLTSALVKLDDSTGVLGYTIGFVPAGDYTVAFTCQALDDSADADDAIELLQAQTVSVTTGQTATADFIYVEPNGSIEGAVAADFYQDASCTSDASTGAGSAVYLYSGADAMPDDFGSGNEPVDSADVSFVMLDETNGEYQYAFGSIAAGDYTLAFSCQAGDDLAGSDEAIEFPAQQNASVSGGQVSVVNFAAGS